MTRTRRLFAVGLAALMVASVATVGGAALGQSVPATVTNSLQTDGANGVQLSPANESSNETDGWGSPRADAGGTGATSDDGPHPYGNVSWGAYESGDGDWGPVVHGDSAVMTYPGRDYPNGIVTSYDTSNGDTEWSQENVGNPLGPATTAGDTVFVATKSDTGEFPSYENRTGLYALDGATGRIEWRVNSTFSVPVAANDRLYASERPYYFDSYDDDDSYGNVVAMNQSTGERVWTSDVQGKVLAEAGGRLIVGNETSDTLKAVDARDGSLLWETNVSEAADVRGNIAATDGTVYVNTEEDSSYDTNYDEKIRAFAADDGSRRWEAEIGRSQEGPSYVSAPAVSNGTVYVVTNGESSPNYSNVGVVHALNAQTGESEWTFPTRVELHGPPAVANGTVYAAGMYRFEEEWLQERNGYDEADWRLPFNWPVVYALDAADGSEQWNLMTDTSINNAGPKATAAADGRFYFTTYSSGTPGAMDLTVVGPTEDRPPWYYHAIDDQDFYEPDRSPTAAIDASPPPGSDGYYEPNTTVTLNGSASADEYGEVVSYEWDVDGDGEYERTGTTVEVTTDTVSCGGRTVTLRVTDDDGNTDTATRTLQTEPDDS